MIVKNVMLSQVGILGLFKIRFQTNVMVLC